MTYQELLDILAPTGIPFAFHHWEAPPPPPYGVYFDPETDSFAADNIAYFEATAFRIEIYSPDRDRALDGRVAAALTAAGIYYDKTVSYLSEEGLYQTVFEIEV